MSDDDLVLPRLRRDLAEVEFKTGEQSEDDPLTFVLSDSSVDRMGDVIEVDGWRLAEFRKNPIALFAHDHRSPIGTWEKVRIEGDRLLGRLKLAAAGTSRLVDEVRSLIEQRVLRAVSVGFQPIEYEPILDDDNEWTGFRFIRQALWEVSVVAVPANANALALAKSLNISPETRRLVFATPSSIAHRASAPATRAVPGSSTETKPRARPGALCKPIARRPTMDPEVIEDAGRPTTLSAQIKAKEKVLHRAELELEQLEADILEADGEMTDEQDKRLDTLNTTIRDTGQALARLRKLEQNKAALAAGSSSTAIAVAADATPSVIRGAAAPSGRKKGDLFVRWMAANILAIGKGVRVEQASEKLFGRGPDKSLHHRVVGFDDEVRGQAKAVTPPAMTTDPAWLGSLVGEETQGFIESLGPDAALPKLLARPSVARANFGPGVASVVLPVEGDVPRPLAPPSTNPPHAAGEFFAEGAPIRVGSFRIEEMALAAKETGVIIPWTRKLEMYSSIELVGFIERVVRRHTAMRLDAILLSATPMTAVSPQGLADPAIPGFTTTAFAPATPGAPTIEEIEDAFGALIDALGPNAVDPVLLAPDAVTKRLGRYRIATGARAFSDELAAGAFMNTPLLVHNTGVDDQVFSLDAGRFVAAYGAPDFDLSSEATLHMVDVNPAPIVAGGTAADPTRSLFQTASRAVRMILDASWAVGGFGRSHQLTGVDL